MENKIYDEKNGLWYEKQGDYYLPCLELPNEETEPIGIWGQRHLHYLKSNRKITYYNLLTSRKLSTYLANIDKQAEDMFSRLRFLYKSIHSFSILIHLLVCVIESICSIRPIFFFFLKPSSL